MYSKIFAFFYFFRRILPDLKKGFDTLFSEFVPHANSANLASDSQSELLFRKVRTQFKKETP
ncbi:hypothetical protein A2409_03770 [Candidatus Curtissbacteria bacterium RIFOXYC1_FULL_41_36]|nr:MAG: hypothetical protein A2409_03770 [Candidatus Curtissbacteria bacterium RIFOXYC1_FULL_41_36]